MSFSNFREATIGSLPAWLRRLGRIVLVQRDRENAMHDWHRARKGVPLLRLPIHRVLVICYGNICRSPFAGELLALRGPGLEVRSAGLEAREGKSADEAAMRIAEKRGVELVSHGAHRMCGDDVSWADLIIAMEGYQIAEVCRRWPLAADKTHLLGDFFSEAPFLIADPYGFDDSIFDAVFNRITAGIDELIPRISSVDV
jgi:protein-tyrosine phosphatase